MQQPNDAEIAAAASKLLLPLSAAFSDVPYERKGVHYSDILFLLACTEGRPRRRVIESGRARGQSTLLLSLALPETEIISVEIDASSEDVAVADARLSTRGNVKAIFGDSRRVIPSLLDRGDIVLIDGPKGFRSVRFALALLQTGKVRGVFVHDIHRGEPYRAFVERWMPEAVYSDSERFMTVARSINRGIAGPESCLTYIPRVARRPYLLLRAIALLAERARICPC